MKNGSKKYVLFKINCLNVKVKLIDQGYIQKNKRKGEYGKSRTRDKTHAGTSMRSVTTIQNDPVFTLDYFLCNRYYVFV